MQTSLRLTIACVAAATVMLFPAFKGNARADAKVELQAGFSPAEIRVGEATVLTVTADVPSGYHLYSMTKIPDGPRQLKITIEAKTLEPLGDWHAPKPGIEVDPNFKKAVEYYAGKVDHQRTFRLTRGSVGELVVQVVVRGQICDEHQCIPFKEKLDAKIRVEEGTPRQTHLDTAIPALKGESFPPDRPAPSADAATESGTLPLGDGFLGFMIIAFLAGLGALVTPCVFPMIPITISFFSKYAEVSLRRSVTMGGIYAGSIVLTFTLIGVIVSLIFGAVGMQTLSASAGFNIFLTLLLVVFAFNLFGLFEIQVPSWLISRTSQKEQELTSDDGSLSRQAAGVFFMALTFTLVSFTCTVAFIGVVLAEAAKGNWFYPALGMLAFSFAFSLPFFFLAVFPSWANKLQGKGGDWMVAVKVVLGFLELAGAFKFLSNVDLVWQWGLITRPLVLAIWVAVFGGAGLYLLRIFNLPHSDPDTRTVGPIRMFFALCMFALAAYSTTGIRDTKSMGGWLDGWLPPAVYPGQEAAEAGESGHLPWIVDNVDKGMEKAKNENVPLFVDFTGYTCTNCRYMEGSVFPRPDVRSRLEKMVLVTAYTDCEQEVCEKQRDYQIKRFDTAALPFYAIINPHDDTVLAKHPDMTKNVSAYIEFLDKGLAAFDRVKPKDEPAAEAAQKSDDIKDAGAPMKAAKPDAGANGLSLDLAASGKKVDFEFPTLKDGKEKIKLSSLRGNWVFVNFWASWCAPCKKELRHDFPPALATASHIKMLTVAFDGEETVESARKFAVEANLYNYITLQGGEEITEAGLDPLFKVSDSLPISYLVHPDGHLAWSRHGSVDKEILSRLFAGTKH